MKPILVLYATREGQTRRVVDHLIAGLTARGIPTTLRNAANIAARISLRLYSAVIVSASVHRGRHEPEIVEFVKLHLPELERMPTAFLSISLTEARAEDAAATSERRAEAALNVERTVDAFLAATGWHPTRIKAVAGALAYSKYNFLVRFGMKRIAGQNGWATDSSKDHEYTDWKDLDHFVDELVLTVPMGTAA